MSAEQPAGGPEPHPDRVMQRAVAGVRLDGQVRHLPASRKLRMNDPGGGPASDAAPGVYSRAIAKEAGMTTRDRPGNGWTVVLRRQPARMVEGRTADGITAYVKRVRRHHQPARTTSTVR